MIFLVKANMLVIYHIQSLDSLSQMLEHFVLNTEDVFIFILLPIVLNKIFYFRSLQFV